MRKIKALKGFLLAGILGVAFLAGCGNSGVDQPTGGERALAAKPIPEGQRLMNTYCASCHMVPDPGDIDTTTWKYYVLVRMASYMGLFWDTQQYYDALPDKWLEPGEGGQRVLNAGVYPRKPVISREDFEKIVDFIVSHAPANSQAPAGILPIEAVNPRFKARPVRLADDLQPFCTGVMLSPKDQSLYISLYQQALLKTDLNGKVLDQVKGYNGIVQMSQEGGKFEVTDIGEMFGADTPKGVFASASSFESLKKNRFLTRLDHLQRPVHARWADLDQDGKEDLLLSEYGNQIGQLTWRKNLGDGKFEERVLFAEDGTLSTHVHDFTGDGLPDIMALMANADESLWLFVNEGEGNFSRERVRRFIPSWGSTSLEVVDFDGDGLPDLIAANGDNADYPAILKPTHGIRLYRNLGKGQFEDAFYLPMNGAYGTQTRDFDLDGDMDIAAVSFYPDYGSGHREAFLYFENQGNMTFRSYAIPEYQLGRWMVIDAADMDGDGDEDIVLGAFGVKSSEVPPEVHAFWQQENVPALILENTTR